MRHLAFREWEFCELRTPHSIPAVTEFLLSGCCDTVEFLPDNPSRDGSHAVEVLKLSSDSPQLIDRLDALAVENVPGKLRQIETFNGSFAGWEMTRHLMFLRLQAGHTHLSAVGVW